MDASNSSSPSLDGADINSDVLVVGAGIVGLCFARDIASLGYYKVTIVERSSQIGGVWASNDYPGLRLHYPGHHYRCLSLAPKWTREHKFDDFYRPFRHEILEYANELVQHENISLLLNTSCDTDKRQTHDDCVIVQLGDTMTQSKTQHATRYLFASLGINCTFAGAPALPFPIPVSTNKKDDLDVGPFLVHSSKLNSKAFERLKSTKGRIVIVGSGKAAIDILQLFPQRCESVLWAHRGHTTFFNRDTAIESFRDGTIVQYFDSLQKINYETQFDRNSTKGVSITCKGPRTPQRIKNSLGYCSSVESKHADTFNQLHIKSVQKKEGKVVLEAVQDNQSITLTNDDVLVFCTGQLIREWKGPTFDRRFARSGPYSIIGPLCSLPSLRVAVETLQQNSRFEANAMRWCAELIDPILGIKDDFDTSREFARYVGLRSLEMCRAIFEDNPTRHGFTDELIWTNEWYGINVGVEDAFTYFCAGKKNRLILDKPLLPSPGPTFETILAEIKVAVARVADIEADMIDENAHFTSLGVDSLHAVALAAELGTKYNTELSTWDMFLFNCLTDLAVHLHKKGMATTHSEREKFAKVRGLRLPQVTFESEWFARQRRDESLDESLEEADMVLLFCFHGMLGKAEISFLGMASELPLNVVPYVAHIPADIGRSEEVSSIEEYLNKLSGEIARAVREHASFALFGHSAGGVLAYLVAQKLRTMQFDLSPLVLFVANAFPPQVPMGPTLAKFIQKRVAREFQISLPNDADQHAKFWGGVGRAGIATWHKDHDINCPLVVMGGDKDTLVPKFILKKWTKMRKNASEGSALYDLELFAGGDHYFPATPGRKTLFRNFWVTVGHKILKAQQINSSGPRCLGPMRSDQIKATSVDSGFLLRDCNIEGKCYYLGVIPQEELVERVDRLVKTDPRFFRFCCQLNAATQQWIPHNNSAWSVTDHVSILTEKGSPTRLTAQHPWHIDVVYEGGNTLLHMRLAHAAWDGFSCMVFLTALHDGGRFFSEERQMPKNAKLRKPFGAKIYKGYLRSWFKKAFTRHPIDPSQTLQTANLTRVSSAVIKLESLSLEAVKLLGRINKATVNDVLLKLIAAVKQRLGESSKWLYCAGNQRTLQQLDRLGNHSDIWPVFLGDGSFKSIRTYTTNAKALRFLSDGVLELPHETKILGDINVLSNVMSPQNPGNTLIGCQLFSQVFIATNLDGCVFAVSFDGILECTYTIDKNKLEKGGLVRETWLSIVRELGLEAPTPLHEDARNRLDMRLDAIAIGNSESGELSGVLQLSDDVTSRPSSCTLTSGPSSCTLAEYREFHSMYCRPHVAKKASASFTGGVIFMPHQSPRQAEVLKMFYQASFTTEAYFELTETTKTRQTTESGRTKFLAAREHTPEGHIWSTEFVPTNDKCLQVERELYGCLQPLTGLKHLHLVRSFEFEFQDPANLSVIMAHYVSEDGKLLLVEIWKKIV